MARMTSPEPHAGLFRRGIGMDVAGHRRMLPLQPRGQTAGPSGETSCGPMPRKPYSTSSPLASVCTIRRVRRPAAPHSRPTIRTRKRRQRGRDADQLPLQIQQRPPLVPMLNRVSTCSSVPK